MLHVVPPLRYRLGGILIVLLLIGFFAYGVDMVVRPKRHMNGYFRRGGEMLRTWNELQVQCVGAIFALFAVSLLYQMFRPH